MYGRRIRPRVLVVDDERVIGDTLTMILKMNGFEASAVYSGEDAVERVGTWQPDILLSDVWMGEMDGIEAARRVRELRPACRIVLLSGGHLQSEAWGEIDRLGFEYLDKPIPPDSLVAHLRAPADPALHRNWCM